MANSFKVINNISKEINVVVIDVSTTDVIPDRFLYEQTLKRIDPSSTELYITPRGGYGVIQFPPAHKDKNGNPVPYTFIIAQAETLAPIYVQTVSLDKVESLEDIIITDEQVDYINTVFDFIQNIAAFPTSDLAVDFAKVLQDGSESDIAAFFANTKGYTSLKMDEVMLVQSYYSALPYGWANKKTAKYYLYTSDYKNNTDTDEPVAQLEVTSKWPVPLDTVPDPDSYKITLYTYDDKRTIDVVFENGTFWDSTTRDIPLVALKGSFVVPSQLTMQNARNQVEPYLYGLLNGYTVFGLNEKAPDDQDGDGGFLDVFAVHNFKEGLDLVLYFVGIGTAIAFFVGCYYGVKYVKNKFKSDDALETAEKAKEVKDYINKRTRELMRKVAIEQAGLLDDFDDFQDQARELAINERLRFARTNLQEGVNALTDSIQSLGALHVDGNIQGILDALDLVQNTLTNGTLVDVGVLIDNNTAERFLTYNLQIKDKKMRIEERMSTAQKKSFKDAQDAYQEFMEYEIYVEQQLDDLHGRNDERGEEGENPQRVVEPRAEL